MITKSRIFISKIDSSKEWKVFAQFVFEQLHTGTSIPILSYSKLEENFLGFMAYTENAKIIGSIALRRSEEKNIVELRNMAVHPDFRHLGVGTKLVHSVLSEGKKLGFKIRLIHARIVSMGFYEKFKPKSRYSRGN